MNTDDNSATTRRVEEKPDEATTRDGAKYGSGEGQDAQVGGLESEQRREADQAWAGPGVPASTEGQAKGFALGSLVGGAIGLVVLLPFAFIPVAGLALTGRLILCAVAGALMGGTVGALYAGGRIPEVEGETRDADGRPSVGSSMRDPGTDSGGH